MVLRLIKDDITLTAKEWGGEHRLQYNQALALAGTLAFGVYAGIVFAFEVQVPDVEISVFTIIFQSIAYVILMGVANIFYYIGPVTEKLIRPVNVNKFRRVTYSMGFWFSVAIPFVVPVGIGYVVLTKIINVMI